jgi:cell fate (sporulation/competence/biofilm development) regulator YlbF (YheA/YmcA/DUF963 family)
MREKINLADSLSGYFSLPRIFKNPRAVNKDKIGKLLCPEYRDFQEKYNTLLSSRR